MNSVRVRNGANARGAVWLAPWFTGVRCVGIRPSGCASALRMGFRARPGLTGHVSICTRSGAERAARIEPIQRP